MSRIDKGLLLTLGALAAAYVLLPAVAPVRLILGHVALTAAPAAAAVFAARAARRGARGAVPVWVLLSIAASAVAIGQLLWAFRQLVLQQAMPFPSASYYLFLAFHPLFACALLVSLREGERPEARTELMHDALLACAAIAVALLRYVYEPLHAARPWLTTAELGWMVGGQFLAQLSLVAAVVLVVWRRTVLAPHAAAAIVLVALINGVANLMQVAGLDPDPGSPGELFDLTWLTGWFVFSAAGAAGGAAHAQAWMGRRALSLSARLRQGIAPLVGLVMTAATLDVAINGGASTMTAIMLAVLGVLLALRLAGTLGAADREQRNQHELERTRVLVALSRTLAGAPDLNDALAHVAAACKQLLQPSRVWIEVLEPEGEVRVAVTQPPAPEVRLPADRSCGSWLKGQRVAQGLTPGNRRPVGPDGLPLPGRDWLAAAAIRFGARVVGTLAVERSDRGFDGAELQLLGALADQAAVAAENARLVEEAREAERTRLRSEKLTGLGQLAAGVAHEINNPLAAIHSAAEMLAAEDVGADHAEPIAIIRTEAGRAARIVRGMLDFVRPPELSVRPVALEELVSDVMRSRATEHARLGIHTELCLHGLPPVLADRGPLEQVFLNLIINAEHALGRVHGERSLTIKGHVLDDGVAVQVRDTGTGIRAENLSRVFDPFFTTKPVGQGTGLGLSVSYGILRELGGGINVESVPGEGTTFTLRLPAAPGSAETCAAPAHEAAPARTSAEAVARPLHVLLVDDEASIRHLVARFLRRRGHTVETAENGRAALDRLEDRAFDVIVTDLKMPVLDGEQLYAHLQEHNPALAARTLFMSGDTVAEGTRDFLVRTQRPFISKPFDLNLRLERLSQAGGHRETDLAHSYRFSVSVPEDRLNSRYFSARTG